jgi:hypothetical protein
MPDFGVGPPRFGASSASGGGGVDYGVGAAAFGDLVAKPKRRRPVSSSALGLSYGRFGAFPKQAGGGEDSFLSDVVHFGENIGLGLYNLGHAAVRDVVNHPYSLAAGPGAPLAASGISLLEGGGGGHLAHDVAIPIARSYAAKYGPILRHPLTGSSYDVARNDPFGTGLDVLALGTIPFGGEGLAIRAPMVAERLVGADSAITRNLARVAVKAAERRAPLEAAYRPGEAAGYTFEVPRARTVQGRHVYQPLREALGRAQGGELPVVGNRIRAARARGFERDLALEPARQNISELERLSNAYRLSKVERLVMPYAARLGPQAVRDAELGAPRQRLVDFYQHHLGVQQQTLREATTNEAQTAARQAIRNLRARLRVLGDGSPKRAVAIDRAFKAPSEKFARALEQARVVEAQGGRAGEELGVYTPEQRALRAELPGRLLEEAGVEPLVAAPGVVDGVTGQMQGVGAPRFAGAGPAFRYPDVGPRLAGPRSDVRSYTMPTGEVRKINAMFRNRGVRMATARDLLGPEAWTRDGLDHLKYLAAKDDQAWVLEHFAEPVEGGIRPGYVAFTPKGVGVKKGVSPEALRALREHGLQLQHHAELSELADEEERLHMAGLLEEIFPAPGTTAAARAPYQVPQQVANMFKREYERADPISRFLNRPVQAWKAITLKSRPAWAVNNILSQHLFYALRSPLGWSHYIDALTPQKRRELARAIPGLNAHGTDALLRDQLRKRGFEQTRRYALKAGLTRFGNVGKVAYRSVSYPAFVVRGFGDLVAKANLELADNNTRIALGAKYVKEARRELRNLELANGALESALTGKSLAEIAHSLSTQTRLAVLKKVDSALGDFSSDNPFIRRFRTTIPFIVWYRTVLRIAADLAIDHPEALDVLQNLDVAAAENPDIHAAFPLPRFLLHSTVAVGRERGGVQPMLSLQGANPLATISQLGAAAASLGGEGVPSGSSSPFGLLGPYAELGFYQAGVDPFFGFGAYQGPGSGLGGRQRYLRGPVGVLADLPPARLAQTLFPGQTGYRRPATYANTDVDAILQYLGYPIRRVKESKAREEAAKGY